MRAIPSVTEDYEVISRPRESEPIGELFDRHTGAVHRFIATQSDVTTACYVVAETFLIAFERRIRFHGDPRDERPQKSSESAASIPPETSQRYCRIHGSF